MAMVKIRKACKSGVTARFVGGRFTVTCEGTTETVDLPEHPADDAEIMKVLDDILDRFGVSATPTA